MARLHAFSNRVDPNFPPSFIIPCAALNRSCVGLFKNVSTTNMVFFPICFASSLHYSCVLLKYSRAFGGL